MQPNATSTNQEQGIEPYKSGAFDRYLTFCALGGLMTDDNGSITTMTLAQFCEAEDIDRTITWRWKNRTPNFAMLVRERRNEIVPLARETAALNRLYAIGMTSLGAGQKHKDQKSAVEALKLYLGHQGNLQLPTQRQEIKHQGDSWGALMARKREEITEGELADPAKHID